MQRFLIYLFPQNALHVSGSSSAHHQEHITVHTASGIVNKCCIKQQYWLTIHEAVCTAVCSWWWGRNRLKHLENF